MAFLICAIVKQTSGVVTALRWRITGERVTTELRIKRRISALATVKSTLSTVVGSQVLPCFCQVSFLNCSTYSTLLDFDRAEALRKKIATANMQYTVQVQARRGAAILTDNSDSSILRRRD